MAGVSTLLNLIQPFLRLLPEVQSIDPLKIPLRQKAIYTVISLLIFLVCSHLPLYGIHPSTGADSLYWLRMMLASNRDTLMMQGIAPILLPEMFMLFLVSSKISSLDNRVRMFMNAAQKFLGIFIAILGAVSYVLMYPAERTLGTGNAILVMLQLSFAGIIVIYLDDVLKKGYGLLSSISLFTATNICVIVLWKALSPSYVVYHGQGAEYEGFEGAILVCVHLLITRTDKLSALREAFCRRNLPNVTNLLATCLFFLIALFFQGFSIVLPLESWYYPGFQVNVPIKLSCVSYAPVVLQCALVSNLYSASELLYMIYGENKLFNLVYGIVNYLTIPPTLADLHRDPVHALLYIVYMLGACALLSKFWFGVCLCSERYLAELMARRRAALAQPDSIPREELRRHLAMTACFGGFCVGALVIFGDFLGVLGSGSGIMLAVTAMYPYFEGRASDVGVFGL